MALPFFRVTPHRILILIGVFSIHVALTVATGSALSMVAGMGVLLDGVAIFLCSWVLVTRRQMDALERTASRLKEEASGFRREKRTLQDDLKKRKESEDGVLQRIKELELEVEEQHVAREVSHLKHTLSDGLPKTLCDQAQNILKHTGAQEVTLFLLSGEPAAEPVPTAQARPGKKPTYGDDVRFSRDGTEMVKVKESMDSGQTMMTSSYEARDRFQEVFFSSPIMYAGSALGALALSMKIEPGDDLPIERELLPLIAERLGTCVHNHRLYEKAIIDRLTTLYCRAHFDDMLNQWFETWQKEKKPFSFVMFDIDRFKLFNDQHGHQTGDQVLNEVGRLAKRIAGEKGMAFRYGGEEMCFLLRDVGVQDASPFAEGFRKAVEQHVVKSSEGKDLKVTISMGVAEIVPEILDVAELVSRADKALYASKEAGRNRVTVSRQAPPPPEPTPRPTTTRATMQKEPSRGD